MTLLRKSLFLTLCLALLLSACAPLNSHQELHRDPSAVDSSLLNAGGQDPDFLAKIKPELEVMQYNVLRFLLDASFESDEVKLERAQAARSYLYQTSAKILRNYMAFQAGEDYPFVITHPPAWTLRTDVNYLTREVEESADKLSPQLIEAARSVFREIDIYSLPLHLLPPEFNRADTVAFLNELKNANSDDQQMLMLMNRFEAEVQEYFDRVSNIGSELASHPDIDLGDEEATKFLKLFLDHYYQNVDEDVLKTILFDVMMLGHEPTPLEGAQIMFRNSGPGLGKGLQQLGKEPSMGKSLSEVLETLEDAGKVVPHYMVSEILANDPGGYLFDEVAEIPLGTGTVAQVQKAMLERDGALIPVAVRFFKPGIEQRAADDIRILSSFVTKLKNENLLEPAMIPQAEKLVSSLKDFLYQELDMNATLVNQRKASEVYAKTLTTKVSGKNFEVEFIVPRLYEPEVSTSPSKLHVQEFLPPKTKFSKLRSRASREAISNTLFELFFREALFGTGFMHSDLHQGNFTVLESKGNKAKVAIYDYGMAHTLSMQARRSFLLIGAGAELSEADLLASGMKSFKKGVSRAELRALGKLIKKELNTNGPKKAEDWIVWGLQHGHLESAELGTMARGSLLIWQLPKAMNNVAQMEDFLELIVEDEVKKSAGKANFPLTKSDRFSLVAKSIKGSCFDMMRRLFR